MPYNYKEKKNYPIDDINDEPELNTASAYDCTGLIPAALTGEEEIEAYEELYPYLPPSPDSI